MEHPRVRAPDSVASFDNVLSIIPQLRSSCASTSVRNESSHEISAVKTLRLVSKLCKEGITGEIHGYTLQLRSQFILSIRNPGAEVHALSAWKFLCGMQLFRLAVQIQDEEYHSINPGSAPVIPVSEVSHHTAQLRCFITTLGAPSLKDVQSLHLSAKTSAKTSGHTGNPGYPLPANGAAIARILAAACPNLTHLTIEGWEAEAAVSVLGPLCPNICSFELIDLQWTSGPANTTSILALRRSFPRLTRLCAVSETHLLRDEEWLALPHTLEEVRCYQLPTQLHRLIAQGLSVGALRVLHSQQPSRSWRVRDLAAFLDAAPELRTLSCGPVCSTERNWFPTVDGITVGSHVTPGCLRALQKLYLRLEAGLVVTRLALDCGQAPIPEGAEGLPLGCLLSALPAFPQLIRCSLTVGNTPPAADCLSRLGRAFPNITTLVLSGAFTDAHLSSLASCKQLQRLEVKGAPWLTAEGLTRCIANAPQMAFLDLNREIDIETADLQIWLESANTDCVVGVGMGALQVPAEWTVEFRATFIGRESQWVKRPSAVTEGLAVL